MSVKNGGSLGGGGTGGGYNLVIQNQLSFMQGTVSVGTITSSSPDANSGRIQNSNWANLPISYRFDNATTATQTQVIKLFEGTITPEYGNKILPESPFTTEWGGNFYINTNYAGNTLFARVTLNTVHFPGTAQQISTKRYTFPISVRSGQLNMDMSAFNSATLLPPNPMTADGSYTVAIPIRLELTIEYFIAGDFVSFNQSTNSFTLAPTAITGNSLATLDMFSVSATFSQIPLGNASVSPAPDYVLPIATQNVLGGIKTGTPVANGFVNGFDASGNATYAVPSGGSGSVNSVSAGFGLELDSTSTATNPVLRTKQTTVDFTSNANRTLLNSVTLASGIYRTLADTNNPNNSGFEDWIVTVYEGDTGQGSVQYWSRCTSTPKVFVRSVDTNSTYGNFVELTYNLPAPTASTLGGVKSNAGSANQFVNGIASDGSLQYATPAGGGSALIFSQRNPRDLFSTSAVSNGSTTVTFGVDVTGLYTPGYLFAFLPRPTSTIFTVVSATFSNGVSTVTFTPAANDTYPIGTRMWEVAQNTPTIVAEGDGIEFDEEGSLTIISLNPPTATTLGGISTGSPTTGQFVQGVNSDGSLKYAIPPGTPYNLPVEMVSMPTATGVDYIVDQASAQAQTVAAIVENINPTSTIRLNSDIPDFPNDRYVALTDTTGRLIIGIYATSAATGLGYAVVNSLRQSRDHLFTATGNYSMTAYLLVTGTSSIFTSGGFSTIPSTRTSQMTFGAGINATIDPANPNAVVLDSRQSNWTVGNVGDPTFIENKFTNNAWITGVIKTSGAAAIGDDSVEVTGNFTAQIIPNTSTIRFGSTDTQNYSVTSVSYIQPSNTTSITFEPTLQTAQASGTNVRLLSALTPSSMTFDTTQFYLESDAAGKQTIKAIAGQAINAVLLGTNTYSTNDITAINGGNGKFTLGSNATGAIEMSTKTLVSSPTALPTTAAQSGIQVGVHVLPSPSTIAVVSSNNVNFINNLTNPTQNILSPNAQTMAGAVAAGSVIVSSDVDEDGALWIMIDYSETDFKLVKLTFSNYSTTPTFISSNVFTIVAPSQQFIGEINEFGITKVSTGNYKIVMTGTATGTSSDAAHVYQATVTLSGSTLTVNTPSTLGPQLSNSVYCTKISNTYGIYAASLSGGQIWKLNSTSTAWNLLYTINPSDQSSQMQIDRSNGNVWAAFDTEEVVRIDQNNNVTQFPKSTLLNWTNVDQGQNTWGIIANGQNASIITYATLTSTSVNANYLLTLSSNAVAKVLDDLQLTNQIIDSVGSQGTSGQVLTVVNNNPTWASPRNVLVFQLAANTGSTAQVTIPFPAAPFITIGKPFGTMNNGVFTASRNVNVRMDFVYNVNATVDSWGTLNANWTTGNRYMQLSANDLKGSVSQIVPMLAGDTFQYRANNAVMWFGGSGTGTYLEMEALD